MRNDSVIVDHLQGLYKSTIVCPKCRKVSVTFEPYMSLAVPLSEQTNKPLELTLMMRDRSQHKVSVVVPTDGVTMDVLKAICDKMAPIPLVAKEMVLCEIWSDRVSAGLSVSL